MVEARWNMRVPMELDIHVLMPDRTPALVVRTQNNGTGLQFADWNDEVADALSRVMESELDCLLDVTAPAHP